MHGQKNMKLVTLCLTMYEIQLPPGTFAVKCTPVSEDFKYVLSNILKSLDRVSVFQVLFVP